MSKLWKRYNDRNGIWNKIWKFRTIFNLITLTLGDRGGGVVAAERSPANDYDRLRLFCIMLQFCMECIWKHFGEISFYSKLDVSMQPYLTVMIFQIWSCFLFHSVKCALQAGMFTLFGLFSISTILISFESLRFCCFSVIMGKSRNPTLRKQNTNRWHQDVNYQVIWCLYLFLLTSKETFLVVHVSYTL